MPTYQVIWNATTKTAGVQVQGASPPAGSLIAGTFEDANGPLVPNTSTVLYHAIRDALYSQGVLDMQRLVIVGGSIPPVTPGLPGVVRNFVAGTATETSQPLSWQAPATGTGPFTYKVGRRLGSSTGAYTQIGGTISGTSYTATGLVADTAYDYNIVATNSAGDSTVVATINDAKTAASGVTPAVTRPGWFVAPANAMTVNTTALVNGRNLLAGSSNGGRAGTYTDVVTDVNTWGWYVALASAGAPVFTDQSGGVGGYVSRGNATVDGQSWQFWQRDYPGTGSSVTVS